MATIARFKKFDEQQTKQLLCYIEATSTEETQELDVGAMISRDATGLIEVVDSLADAITAKDNGLPLYIIAQSDAVTNKTGTPYKTYIVGNKKVTVNTDQVSGIDSDPTKQSLLVAYNVDHLDNVEFITLV